MQLRKDLGSQTDNTNQPESSLSKFAGGKDNSKLDI